MKKIQIVYPLERSLWEQELKYSLRSLEMFLKEGFNVTIIGYLPKYIDRKKVTYIPYEDHQATKAINRQGIINSKILLATDLYDDFVVFNDDIYLLKETSFKDFKQNFFLEELNYDNTDISQLTFFQKVIYNGYIISKNVLNIKPPILNHVCHMPYYYESKILREVNKAYNLERGDAILENAYFNYIGGKFKNCNFERIGFWYKPSKNDIEQVSKGNFRYLFHNDDGLNNYVKKFLKEKFPEKSAFEKACE